MEHLIEAENGRLRALTPTGDFHMKRLRLNRDELVAHRREQRRIMQEREEKQLLLGRVAQLEQRVETLQTLISTSVPRPDDHKPS